MTPERHLSENSQTETQSSIRNRTAGAENPPLTDRPGL